jgi:hypothetical protein
MEWYQVLMIVLSNFGMALMMYVGTSREMKDFHGRLERQDAEFKSHMTYYHSAKE